MAEKRAHHNALERKRRDHIKDSFSSLRESVPALQGEKVASRALILKKAADYIQFMRRKNTAHQQDIDDLKRQNTLLESQINKINMRNERQGSTNEEDGDDTQNTPQESEIRTLEKAKATGNFAAETSEVALVSTKTESVSSFPRESESDTSDSEAARATRRSKKLKVAGL